MCRLKLLIVPQWLNLVTKELGLSCADLLDCEKLSGILSPRDLLIYKMVQFRMGELLDRIGLKDVHADFSQAIAPPSSLEIAFTGNLDTAQLFYGTTVSQDIPAVVYEIKAVAQDTLAIFIHPEAKAPVELKEETRSLAHRLVLVMHGMLPLNELARTQSFTQYVDKVPVNAVSY